MIIFVFRIEKVLLGFLALYDENYDEIEYDTRTHHTNMDSYERIQPDDMKQASVIMAAFIYNAAMRDEKLPRKALPVNVQQATAPTVNASGAAAGAGRTNK